MCGNRIGLGRKQAAMCGSACATVGAQRSFAVAEPRRKMCLRSLMGPERDGGLLSALGQSGHDVYYGVGAYLAP